MNLIQSSNFVNEEVTGKGREAITRLIFKLKSPDSWCLDCALFFTHTHSHTLTRSHTNIYTHTRTLTYIHTYTHTHSTLSHAHSYTIT